MRPATALLVVLWTLAAAVGLRLHGVTRALSEPLFVAENPASTRICHARVHLPRAGPYTIEVRAEPRDSVEVMVELRRGERVQAQSGFGCVDVHVDEVADVNVTALATAPQAHSWTLAVDHFYSKSQLISLEVEQGLLVPVLAALGLASLAATAHILVRGRRPTHATDVGGSSAATSPPPAS